MNAYGSASKMENGQFAELGASILRQLAHIPGLNKEVAKEWIGNPLGLRAALAKVLVPNSKDSVGNTVRLLVNYDLRVDAAVRNGKYDLVNSDVNGAHFRTNRTGQKEVEMNLFHFNRAMSSEQAIEEMRKQGYRPAELHELLAFGAKCPDEQTKYPIVAFGSVWRRLHGDRGGVACLRNNAGERNLDLYYSVLLWHEDCRFLAVRES